MRAVIYARYPSDLQRDASIEDQVRQCKVHIDRDGMVFIGTYSDHAVSGSIRMRPGYQKLLEDARKRLFDVVVAEALDRLSRDQEDVAALYKHLTFADVQLVTLSEGRISELRVGLKGTMNALFLKDLAQKVRRGLEGRVRERRSGGGLGYGYDVVREYDSRGEPIRGGRKINENEADIVARIFREFAAGKSPRAIAKALNAEQIEKGVDDPVTDLEALHLCADLHHFAGAIRQRYAAGRNRRRIGAVENHHVAEVERACPHSDEHLADAGRGHVSLGEDKAVPAAKFVQLVGAVF
jgi:DNA invertase Pin-like site-specific DNA recombinase